jgi:hypothetical protein
MARRYSFIFAALLGVVTVLVILAGVVVAMPGQTPALPAPPTFVVLPTPTLTALPIVTPTPTPGPAGDQPAGSIAPFGDN